MVRVDQSAAPAEQLLSQSVRWYGELRVPQAFRGLPGPVLDHLIAVTGGDWRRCVIDEDGVVMIYNGPAWERTA